MATLQLVSSPSSETFHPSNTEKDSSLQTTPKLPRRERLASFSRLVSSEHFKDLRSGKQDALKSCRKSFNKLALNSEGIPDIRISPCSPASKSPNHFAISKIKENGTFVLPFSPNINPSLNYESPTYRKPTPTRSPLYVSDSKRGFLGRGSFGNVTLCAYKGVKYALKVTQDRVSCNGERNFINIRHPHLVSVLYIAPIMDKVFICMEFAGHCNLQQVLDTKSELDFPRRLSFTVQIALALRHCHQRHIVHGDVKPANVIVSPFGICKLCDFGHSINLDSSTPQTNESEDVIGTVAYAAPEVLRGSKPGLPSDIFSFGILLWQVHTRDLPFAGEHPHVILYKVAHYGFRPEFQTSFCKDYETTAKCCWREEPNQRPEISDVLKHLQDIGNNLKTSTLK